MDELTDTQRKQLDETVKLIERIFILNPKLEGKLRIRLPMEPEVAEAFTSNLYPTLWISFKPLNKENTYWEFDILDYS